MKLELGPYTLKITRTRRAGEYELQEVLGVLSPGESAANARKLVWFSGDPYYTRTEATRLADDWHIRPGNTLRVRNVRTGHVVYQRHNPAAA